MSIVINLFAGPGAGTSTTAAALFSKLKTLGKSVELVTEYAKDETWKGHKFNEWSQPSILGEQWGRESKLYGKVDYIITDSPIELPAIYGGFYGRDVYSDFIGKLRLLALEQKHVCRAFFINRTKPFVQAGRNETEDQARQVDSIIRNYLATHRIAFNEITSDLDTSIPTILHLLGV